MASIVYIVGVGPGSKEFITLEGQKCIEKAEVLIGAKGLLDSFNEGGKDCHWAIKIEDIYDRILEEPRDIPVAVLLSGDTSFYSSGVKLAELLFEHDIEYKLVSGISTIQYFANKICVNWDDIQLFNLSSDSVNIPNKVAVNEKTFFLTNGEFSVNFILKELVSVGLTDLKVYVGENLSYEDERITVDTPNKLLNKSFSPLSIVLIINNHFGKGYIITHGIDDDLFIKSSVPMTKFEVRSIAISLLKLSMGDVFYDIGANTGAMSVEVASQSETIKVYSIESNSKAYRLIEGNKEKFKLNNMYLVKDSAPFAFESLPAPDKVFISGSNKRIETIVLKLIEKGSSFRIVINSLALDSISESVNILEKLGFDDIKISNINISKSEDIRSYKVLKGDNPAFLISAYWKGIHK